MFIKKSVSFPRNNFSFGSNEDQMVDIICHASEDILSFGDCSLTY